MTLKKAIKDFGLKLGLDLVGFASAEPFLKEEEVLRKREALGLRSPFEERNVDLRCYPHLHVPEAKTIISCAIAYQSGDLRPQGEGLSWENKADSPFGVISRYGRVRDYHEVLGDKLNKLAQFISQKKDHRYKIFVDTGSLMDKAVAIRAGIGWLGANTCLFTPGLGSWVFLGEILTDIELSPDDPLESQCDLCLRCVHACPTGALIEPFIIDSHRCLSYITQMRGNIPQEFQKPLGRRLFGCDTCQEACPHNRQAKAPNSRDFVTKVHARQNLIELIHMSNKEFRQVFQGSAASWRGKNVIRRNALSVLSNVGSTGDIRDVERLLDDPSEIVRNQARRTLKLLK